MSDIQGFLSRLNMVKQTKPNNWLACCPAHDDRSPSMTIRLLDDGRILVHDFAGCSVSEIVAAVGLELSDLMPEKLTAQHGEKVKRHSFNPYDVIKAVVNEMRIVALIAFDQAKGKVLTEDERARLLFAAERLNLANEAINGKC